MRKVSLLMISLFLGIMSYAQETEPPTGSQGSPVTIDGLLYKLDEATHTAMLANYNQWTGELDIPEHVSYKDQVFAVDRIEWLAFDNCQTLTKVRIPKTISAIVHYAYYEDCKNPFKGCTSLECIEVDEENPYMCSVDGVLFNKDRSQLYCYPSGARNERYMVPDGVTWIGGNAFAYNPYLVSVTMPSSVTYLAFGLFSNCKLLKSIILSKGVSHIAAGTFENCGSLAFLDIPESVTSFAESVFRWSPIKTLVIRGTFPQGLRKDTFYFMDDEVVVYVRRSEIEKFKEVFPGMVLPLEDYTSIQPLGCISDITFNACDLQGRRVNSLSAKGIYIQNGRKVVVK